MPFQHFSIVPDERFIVLQLQDANMNSDACDEMHVLIKEELKAAFRPVILDMRRAKFLPSLAIGALISIKRKLDESGSPLTLVGLSSNIRMALEVSHLEKLFHIVNTLEDAVLVAGGCAAAH